MNEHYYDEDDLEFSGMIKGIKREIVRDKEPRRRLDIHGKDHPGPEMNEEGLEMARVMFKLDYLREPENIGELKEYYKSVTGHHSGPIDDAYESSISSTLGKDAAQSSVYALSNLVDDYVSERVNQERESELERAILESWVPSNVVAHVVDNWKFLQIMNTHPGEDHYTVSAVFGQGDSAIVVYRPKD